MKLFNRIKLRWLTRKDSSRWREQDKKKIIDLIDSSNKEIEVVREEIFEGEGKPYRYFYDNGKIQSEGFFYSLGYDKKGNLRDEKLQGKNIEYYENGQVRDIFYYKDGNPTGEYYRYHPDGQLDFYQPPLI